jgi:hypothetical protein
MSSPRLSKLEASYKAAKSPSVQADLQVQIDKKLTELGKTTRFYTPSELESILASSAAWPTEPRETLAERARIASLPPPPAPVVSVPRPTPAPAAPKPRVVLRGADPDFVEVDGRGTLTLDALIRELSALRDRLGGDAPAWHVEFGGVTGIYSITEWEGGACIE